MNKKTEIVLTQKFKANDMFIESDLLLQFKIREILEHTPDVDDETQVNILRSEAMRIEKIKREAERTIGMQVRDDF